MQLYFLTAVGWSLDASGNLQARDTAGNLLSKFVSGFFGGKLNKSASVSSSPISTTTSTSLVSSGIGGSLTTLASTSVLLICNGVQLSNNTASDGAALQFVRNTTGVPAGGTSIGTDTVISASLGSMLNNASTAGLALPLGVVALDTTAVVGTAYFYYIGIKANTGGTATVNISFVWAVEI